MFKLCHLCPAELIQVLSFHRAPEFVSGGLSQAAARPPPSGCVRSDLHGWMYPVRDEAERLAGYFDINR